MAELLAAHPVLLGLAAVGVLCALVLVASGGRLLSLLAAALPTPALLLLGRSLGAAISLLGIRRRVALANLAVAFPERDEAWRRTTLRAFYRHLGLLIVEFLRSPALSPEELDRLVEVEGFENFTTAQAAGHGAIVVTAHFGNFELLGSLWARRGVEVTAITKRLSRNPLNAFWLDQRRRAGLRELPDSGSIRDILRVLREKKTLAILIDQNMIPRRAIFVPFLGRLAATTPAPAVFAERTGAPVVLALLHRLPGGRHKVTLEGPIPFERTGDRERDVKAFTARLNAELERHVRAEPELWWWVHRRWKTRPPEESAAAAEPGPAGGG